MTNEQILQAATQLQELDIEFDRRLGNIEMYLLDMRCHIDDDWRKLREMPRTPRALFLEELFKPTTLEELI
jgi:hypothetical protein